MFGQANQRSAMRGTVSGVHRLMVSVETSNRTRAIFAESLAAVREIAALPPHAVAASRRLMRGAQAQIDGHIEAEAEAFRKRLVSPEAKAAFAAFLNKKK